MLDLTRDQLKITGTPEIVQLIFKMLQNRISIHQRK
jgi:hypothetical protein